MNSENLEQICLENKKNMEKILKILKEIQQDIKDIKYSNSKMDNHIDFIENIYNILKNPLTIFSSTLNRITGNTYEDTSLPDIKIKKLDG